MSSKIEIPVLDENKVDEIRKMKLEISQLEIEKNKIPAQIFDMKDVQKVVQKDKDTKQIMEDRVPGLYRKDIKKLDKELRTIEDAIANKKREDVELTQKIQALESKIPELETKLYGLYQIELSRLYYRLHARALKDNSHKYDNLIREVNKLRYTQPQGAILQRIERPNLSSALGIKPSLVS